MIKRFSFVILLLIFALSATSCSIENKIELSDFNSEVSTQPGTRIYNNFRDLLPEFDFDSEPVEDYREGISYSFSAKCTDKDFKKYIDVLKNSGFNLNAVEAYGYYAARTADKFYVESTLVDGTITVYVKR